MIDDFEQLTFKDIVVIISGVTLIMLFLILL